MRFLDNGGGGGSDSEDTIVLSPPPPNEMTRFLEQFNPTVSQQNLKEAGALVVTVFHALSEGVSVDYLRAVIVRITESSDRKMVWMQRPGRAARTSLADEERGTGLSPDPLSRDEGLALLRGKVRQVPVEEWAGETMGANDVCEWLHISRTTLQKWHADNRVIGLPRGIRNRVYPKAQFLKMEQRPIAGIADVVAEARSQAAAWLWLIADNPELNGEKPLVLLNRAEFGPVIDLAKREFGPQ